MVEVRNLTQNVKYLDRSEMKQQPKEIENLLKGVSINTFTYAEGIFRLFIFKKCRWQTFIYWL